MKRKVFMSLFVLICTISVSAQQAVYNYYPRIVMGSSVEQVKQKMKGLSGYKFDSETNISGLHFITYVRSNGTQMLLHFDSKGKLTSMDGDNVSATEFKNTINQLKQELKSAGKDDEGIYVENSSLGQICHLFDLSGTNVALFMLTQSFITGGYNYSIKVIDKGLKEQYIKDAK